MDEHTRPLALKRVSTCLRLIIPLFCLVTAVAHAGLMVKSGETFTLNSSETLTVDGKLTIENGAKLVANGATIRVSGNWDNQGTFDAGQSYVYLTGESNKATTVTGSTTFHKLTVDKGLTDASKKFVGTEIKFESSKTQIITNKLILKGKDANNRLKVSSEGSGTHTLKLAGTATATVDAQYLDIQYSNLQGADALLNLPDSISSGNTSGWFPSKRLSITSKPITPVDNGGSLGRPTITIQDADGHTVTNSTARVTVKVSGGDGKGALNGTTTATASAGVATLSGLTLSGTVGKAYTLTFTSTDLSSATTTVTVKAAGAASKLAVDGGDGLSAPVGKAVETAPSVKVTDANGNPVKDVEVNFAVASGNGSITGDKATTDTDGIATVDSWTLGTTAGTNTLTATAEGLTASVTFTATGTVGTATQIAENADKNQSATVGSAVSIKPSVMVKDASDNPVENEVVTFAVTGGDGSITGDAKVTTGTDGIATVGSWTLGTTAGTNTLTATVDGLDGYPVTFTATGTAGTASTSTSTITASDASIEANGSSTSTIRVQLKDKYDNDLTVSGGTVSLTTTAGTLSGVTDNNNGTYSTTLTSATTADTATISATLDGDPITSGNATVVFNADKIPLIPEENKIESQKVRDQVNTHRQELAAISIIKKKKEGKYEVRDEIPDDAVKPTTGTPDRGTQDGLIDTDKNDRPDYLYISTTGKDVPDIAWNISKNKIVAVNMLITDLSGKNVGDKTGYPLGSIKSVQGASNRPQLKGVADDPNHAFKAWARSDGEMVAVTGTLYTSSTPDENGKYPWEVNATDYVKPLDAGDNMVMLKGSVSVPLPVVVVSADIDLTISANRKQSTVGSIVTYTVELENKSAFPLSGVAIRNDLPPGFSYVEGSLRWDQEGHSVTPIIADGGSTLQFGLGSISTSGVYTLRYQLRIGSGVKSGIHRNAVTAVDNNGTPQDISDDFSASAIKAAEIRVVEDALFDQSTVVGKVFNDVNGNGWQDPGDAPVPYVRLVTSAGQRITADGNGQYHLGNMRGGRMVVRIDERSLPNETKIVGRRSQVVDIRSGIPSKVNFAVQLPVGADTDKPARIEKLSEMLRPSLTVGAFGSAQVVDNQQRFVEPLEIRSYSNYSPFIDQWRVLITEEDSRRVVKTFSGPGSDFFAPIYWDGSTDNGEVIDPQRGYNMQLLVADSDGREASTNQHRLTILALKDKFEPATDAVAQAKPSRAERDTEHRRWLQLLAAEDSSASSRIPIVGKSIRVSGPDFSAVRISRDGEILVEIPSYNNARPSLVDLMRGISQHKDLAQEISIEVIVPRSKLNIQVLGNSARSPSGQAESPSQQDSIPEPQTEAAVEESVLEQFAYLFGMIVDFVFPKAYGADFEQPNLTVAATEVFAERQSRIERGADVNWLHNRISHQITDAEDLKALNPGQSLLSVQVEETKSYPSSRPLSESVEGDADQQELEVPAAGIKSKHEVEQIVDQPYKIPWVSIEFLLKQEEYKYTIEITSGNDPQQLLEIAEDYRKSQIISRFALLIVAKGDGDYALIYGIYQDHKQAKHTLGRELPRAIVDAGAQIRSIQSMELSLKANLQTKSVEDDSVSPQVVFEQDIDIEDISAANDYFLVGIVDAEIAYRDITGNMELANAGDSRYGDRIWKDGKVQLYFKGTVPGEYLVTASVDSERDSEDLFSNLDPDASYALYGDNTSVSDLVTEADGMLYLLVEKDLSWAKWGRLKAALDNSQLASFQRSLQGAQVHYESEDSTSYGEAVTEADAFVARVRQKSAHIEFISTGSSLYYLKHQGALRDSLRLRIEVRDAISGNIKSSRQLAINEDYQFDAASGRITFWQPPERDVQSELLIGSERGAVDAVYLVADYNYSIVESWNQGVSGGQIEQALGDNIRLGVTQVEEQQQGGAYHLEGVNSSFRVGKNHNLHVEYARSESRAEPKYLSIDGGLSWGISEPDITADDSNQSGDAISLRGDAAFLDGRTHMDYYARDIAEGFSSGSSHHQRGQKAAGLNLNHRFNDDLSMRFKHDWQARLGAGEVQSNHRTGAQKNSSSSLQVNYELGDKLTLSGEVRHQTTTDPDPSNLSQGDPAGDSFAVQGRYRFDEDTELSLTQQGGGGEDSQTRIGLRKRFDDRFSLETRLSQDGSGVAYGVGSTYNLHDKLSLNTAFEQDSAGRVNTQIGTGFSPNENTRYNLAIQERRGDDVPSQSVILGTSRKLGNSTTLGTGVSLALSGENKRNSSDVNLSHELADGRTVRGSLSRYSQQEAGDSVSDGHEINLGADINSNWAGFLTLGQGDIHRLDGGLDKRRNLAIGGAYIRTDEDQQEQLTGRLRFEQRQDRGQQNLDTYLMNIDIKGRLNDHLTVLSALDWGQAENLDEGTLKARNNRFDLSAAYRPVFSDQLNIIGKYSWVEEKQPDAQAGDIGFEQHKGHVLATDLLFDLTPTWRLGTKLAARYGDEKMSDMPWTKTERWLAATRLGYRFTPDTTLNLEYRLLKDLQAQDQQEGSVIELVRRFEKIEVGIGVNYAGFSDDLGIMDYTEQRGYLRITGVLE